MNILQQKSDVMSSSGLATNFVGTKASGYAVSFPSFVLFGPNHKHGAKDLS